MIIYLERDFYRTKGAVDKIAELVKKLYPTMEFQIKESDLMTEIEGDSTSISIADRYTLINKIDDIVKAIKDEDRTSFISSLNGSPLTGSEKQIAWGEKIRQEKMLAMREKSRLQCVNPEYAALKTAKYWIENRNVSSTDLGGGLYRISILKERLKNETDEDKIKDFNNEIQTLSKKLNLF